MITITQTQDIATCRALRREVFIIEQGVSEADEIDDLDDVATHLLAEKDGAAIGSARLLTLGDTGKIGRVCVRKSARGMGIGAALTRKAVEVFAANPAINKVKLSAQSSAIGFYKALGFTAHGPEYQDAGIAHRDMFLLLDRAT